jgi:hypothetical protein
LSVHVDEACRVGKCERCCTGKRSMPNDELTVSGPLVSASGVATNATTHAAKVHDVVTRVATTTNNSDVVFFVVVVVDRIALASVEKKLHLWW